MAATGTDDRMRRTLARAWAMFGPFLGLIAVAAFFAWQTRASGRFVSPDNVRTIVVQSTTVGIAALGVTLVMIAGGIDLSIGSAMALVTVYVAVLVRDYHAPILVAMTLGVLLGGVCGLFNGSLITGLGVVPFIVTLGSLKIFRGLAKRLAGDTQVYISADGANPAWLDQVLSTSPPSPSWMIVAPGVWVFLGLALLLALTLRYSVLGRYVYAVGSSEPTARLCGINVPMVKLTVYGLAGLATGLAGVMQFLELSAQGDPGSADGMELQAIAAVVIGGGSLSGGEGTVLGTLIGCLLISTLNSGCVHAGYGSSSRDVIIGAIIVAAVTIDRLRRRAR
jgi:ribose/xylose/arabinose/galactoside ABC-type transport system permease subunit